MEESYKIKLNTPIGVEEGILTLCKNNNKVSGTIRSKKGSYKFDNGSYQEGQVSFKGSLRIALMVVSYEAICRIESNKLKGTVTTKYGVLKVEGTKI